MEFNALSRSIYKQVAPLCQQHKTAVVAFSVTARGLLTGKIQAGHTFDAHDIRFLDPQFQRECFSSGLRVAEKFAAIGLKYGKTPAQMAIAWGLAQSHITCALTGPSSVLYLEENLDGSGWQIEPQDLDILAMFLEQEANWLSQEQRKSI